jgi:hypothetical protein
MAENLPEVPEDVMGWIGKELYQERGEFPVERGYIWTACASVEMGNPLYWDDEVADLQGYARKLWQVRAERMGLKIGEDGVVQVEE